MMEDLIAFLGNVKSNPRLRSFNEDQTKMGIVLPILRRVGWDTENVDEVSPEFSVESRRVDYALRVNNRSVVFVEAKRPGEDLVNHEEQLLDYSFRQAVDISVLTNGITWAFYLPRADGDWKSRRAYTIDIIEQEVTSVASKFFDLLSKKDVESGKAHERAEELRKTKVKEKTIQEALPEAWNRLIEEPDSLLVDLLAETAERIRGYKPEPASVMGFLKQHEAQFLLLPVEEREGPKKPPVAPRPENELPNDKKISQDELIPHIIRVLKKHGGQARKQEVENEIFNTFKGVFSHAWYQEHVSWGVPRWQHNLAWAKERAKKRGLIKWPSDSRRGYWALTEKGRSFD